MCIVLVPTFFLQPLLWPEPEEGEWMSVDDFFQEKAPADVKKRVKTLAAKKNWLVKEAQPAVTSSSLS